MSANMTPSRVGQINGGGSSTALFLKVFSGEILTAFNETNVMMDRHTVRTISSGQSAQFPATWKTTAAYHTPGALITGNVINHAERVINIDGLLISHASIANIDEAINHYDVRGEYTKQLGAALARTFDRNVLQVGVLAARAATTVTGGFGGTTITNAAMNSDGEVLADAIVRAAQTLDEKDIPEDGRFVVLRPAEYYRLIREAGRAMNRDFGGTGVYSDGKVFRIAGIEIVKSNNLPSSNIAQVSGTNNTYHGDFTKTVGLVMHKSAVGTVKLLDMAVESEYLIQNQSTLMVAKYLLGHGVLRPECAVELALP